MDLALAWIVVTLPTLGSLGLALVDSKIRGNRRLFWTLIVFGLVVSILTWIQMSRAMKAASADRESAIVETSEKVSATVSRSVSKSVAATGIRCLVDYQASNDLHPEIEEEALQGSVDNAVIIHAPKGNFNSNTENFVQTMDQLFCVKRRYDVYHEGKPDQAIWLQIGRGFPWHLENTIGTWIGTLPPKPRCPA